MLSFYLFLLNSRLHPDRSGFEGPWVADPTKLSNAYFVDLLKGKWEVSTVASTGNKQFTDKTKNTHMLPTYVSIFFSSIYLLRDIV
jgi:cytochrome c peroxidase